jgi:sigma-E factor negative regulatory protein RseC
MIEDIGTVVRVAGDKAFIEVERTSACAQCGLQEVEEVAGGKPVFVAINKAQANAGDMVKVRVESVAYMKASLFIYGIPILFLISGAILGAYLAGRSNKSVDTMSAFFGFLGLIVGIILLALFRKKGKKEEYMPVIVEVIKEDVVT